MLEAIVSCQDRTVWGRSGAERARVLAARRDDGVPPWVFVGGSVEADETLAEAAVREAREEAGIVVAARVEIGRRVHPRTHRLVVYLECAPDGRGGGRHL